jgi:elongin-A
MYSARVVPPMPVAKTYAQCTKPTFLILPPPPSPQTDGQLSRVTVNTVKRLASSSTSHKPPSQPPLPTLASSEKPALDCDTRLTKPPPWPAYAGSSAEKSLQSKPCQPVAPPCPGDPAPRKTAKSPKKDPMACLFLPKQRVRPTKV